MAELTKEEREAVRERLIVAIGSAARLYTLLDAGPQERLVVSRELGGARRHLRAAQALIDGKTPDEG